MNPMRGTLTSNLLPTSVALALVLAAASPAYAAEPATPTSAGHPSADGIIQQMSDTLGAAQQLSFTVSRQIDPDLAKLLGLQEATRIEVAARRPDKLVARSVSVDDERHMYADGHQFSLVDAKQGLYATVPLTATLDSLPGQLAQVFGFAPPLTDFVVSNPHTSIAWRASRMSYRGMDTLEVNGAKCYRIALSGRLVESDLWIGVDDHLPKQMTASFSGVVGTHYKLVFSDWNLAAKLADSEFVYSPPEDALQITMMTEAEIQTAKKKK